MTVENTNAPRKRSPLEDFLAERTLEVRSDLKDLFATLEGDELLEAVIERIQRYAIETLGDSERENFRRYKSPHMLGTIRETFSEELTEWISNFISDAHREFIVRCHARGIATAEAVSTLIQEDKTLSRLAQTDVMGTPNLRRALVTRLAYLKPGTARWPERKYGAIWREAREQHKQDIGDIPLTSSREQVAVLAKHVDYINETLYDSNHSVNDVQVLTDALIKTVEALQKLSATEQQVPPNLSGAQLITVLEKLTLNVCRKLKRGVVRSGAILRRKVSWNATRANVIHCPASPHATCATDFVYSQTKSRPELFLFFSSMIC